MIRGGGIGVRDMTVSGIMSSLSALEAVAFSDILGTFGRGEF